MKCVDTLMGYTITLLPYYVLLLLLSCLHVNKSRTPTKTSLDCQPVYFETTPSDVNIDNFDFKNILKPRNRILSTGVLSRYETPFE